MSNALDRLNKISTIGSSSATKKSSTTTVKTSGGSDALSRLNNVQTIGGGAKTTAPTQQANPISGEAWTRAKPSQTVIPQAASVKSARIANEAQQGKLNDLRMQQSKLTAKYGSKAYSMPEYISLSDQIREADKLTSGTKSDLKAAKNASKDAFESDARVAPLRKQLDTAMAANNLKRVSEISDQLRSIRAEYGAQTIGDRVNETLSAGLNYSGAMTANAAGFAANTMQDPVEYQRKIKELENTLKTGRDINGFPVTQKKLDAIPQEIADLQAKIKASQSGTDLTGKIYGKADELNAAGQKSEEAAKAGLGKVGTTLVDAGMSTVQSGADALVGLATGTGMLPFAVRSFGGSSMEARNAGASLQDQFLYGGAEAAKELFTEKLFGMAMPQKLLGEAGRGGLDGIVEKGIRNVTDRIESQFGQRAVGGLLTWLSGGVSEGMEEVIGGIIENTLINPNLKGFDPDTRTMQEKFEDGLYDFIVGAVSGMLIPTNLVTYSPNGTATAETAAPATAEEQLRAAAMETAQNALRESENAAVESAAARAENAAQRNAEANRAMRQTAEQVANIVTGQKAAATMGENGSRAFRTAYNSDLSARMDSATAYSGFTAVYDAAIEQRVMTESEMKRADQIPESMVYAATVAAQADLAKARQAAYFGKNSGLVRNNAFKKMNYSERDANRLDAIGKAAGVQIEIVNDLKDENGFAVNASYSNGKIQISSKTKNPMRSAVTHEVVHRIREVNPQAYKELATFVQENIKDMSEQAELRYMTTYDTTDADAVTEEMVADAFGYMLNDSNYMDNFAKNNRSAAQKLMDALKNFLAKIRNVISNNDLRLTSDQTSIFRELEGMTTEMETLMTRALESTKQVVDAKTETSENEKGNIKYSKETVGIKDSDGNALSEQQIAFFKNSKVRDEHGNLKVMYHGTADEFTVFDVFKQGGKNGTAEGYGIYFADTKDVTDAYGGKTLKGYVNMERPARSDAKTIKKTELAKLIQELCVREAESLVADGEYSKISDALKDTWISNYVDTYSQSISSSYKEVAANILEMNDSDMGIVQEIMVGMGIRNYKDAYSFYDTLTEVTGIDGFMTEWENKENADNPAMIAVALNSNQFKNQNNTNPTKNSDIRYSRTLGEYADIQIITGDELKYFGVDTKTAPRQLVKDIVNKLIADGVMTDHNGSYYAEIQNADTKDVVRINHRGLEETFEKSQNYQNLSAPLKELKIAAVRYLPQAIRYGEVVVLDGKELRGLNNFHVENQLKTTPKYTYIHHPVVVDGVPHELFIEIRKTPQNNTLWIHKFDMDINKIGEDLMLKKASHKTGAYDSSQRPSSDKANVAQEKTYVKHSRELETEDKAYNWLYTYQQNGKTMYGAPSNQDLYRHAARTAAELAAVQKDLQQKIKENKISLAEAKLAGQMAMGRELAPALRRANEALSRERAKQEAERAERRNRRFEKQWKKAESEARTKLLHVAQRLERLKTTQANRALIDELIGDLDTVSKSMTSKTLNDLRALQDWYNEQKQNNPDFIDPATEKKLERLKKKQIADKKMDIQDVVELNEVLRNIENRIRTQNQFIESQIRHETYEAGSAIIQDVESVKGTKKNVVDWVVTNTLSPVRAIRRMVGYNDGSPLKILVDELANGQRTMIDYQMRAEKLFSKWTNDQKFIDSLRGKKNADRVTVHGFDNKTGEAVEVQITKDMRMALYLHSLNDQNKLHIAEGGITIPDLDLLNKGQIAEAYARGTTIKMQPSVLNGLFHGMSAEERAFANQAGRYFNGMSREEINGISEKLVGYSIAGVDNYFPINTDTRFSKKEFDSLKRDGTIEGMGFLKERVNAKNPIMLRGMTDVLNQSIGQHAKYVGLAIPVRNFGKVWSMTGTQFGDGKSDRFVDINATRKDGTDYHYTPYTGSVQQAIESKWGSRATGYIEKMMTDLQNGGKSSEELDHLLAKARSNYAGAVLTLNAGVALKQAASYPTAAAVLGWKPLAQAMGNVGKVDLKVIEKYTPLLWYRSKGFSTQELGDINARGKSLPKALNWIQAMDIATTEKLWKASEYYVRDHNKNLKVGTDDYYKAVAEVYNRVIEETQPNYTTMQRPQLLRSDSSLVQSISMFKTQPFQNFNVLYDAAENYKAKKGTSEAKAAKADLTNAVTSQIVQTAVFAAMTAVWNAIRKRPDKYKDEDGEVTFESVMTGILKDMAAGAVSIVPFGSDVYSFASSIVTGDKYYGVDSVSISAVNDLLDATIKMADYAKDMVEDARSGDGVDIGKYGRKMVKPAEQIAQGFGVPASNVMNMFDAAFHWATTAYGGKYLGEYEYLSLTTSKSDTAKYYDLLFSAKQNSEEDYKALLDLMEEDDFDMDKVEDAMKKREKKRSAFGSIKKQKLSEQSAPMKESSLYSGMEKKYQKAADDWLKKYTSADALAEAIDDYQLSDVNKRVSEAKYVEPWQYALYQAALKVANDTNPDHEKRNKSYDTDEKERAINSIPGLGRNAKAEMFEIQNPKAKNNPFK